MLFAKKPRLQVFILVLLLACPFPPLAIARKEKTEKGSNLKGGGKVSPIHRTNEHHYDESDQRRHLALSTAVNYPNPCFDLPANRVPEFNSTNPVNDGWTLAGDLYFTQYGAPFTMPLPFPVTVYGQNANQVTIHNEGFLMFPDISMSLYVFLSQVDTRGDNGGYVWRKTIGTNKFAVAWDNVGYYDHKSDKLNTFQVLLSDGTDESMGLGNNVCYCYDDMQWTTSGLGQVVALNMIGTFSQPGTAYDGGGYNADGFDYLDRKAICVKASGSNIPPVAVNVPENNRIDLNCGQSVTNHVIFFNTNHLVTFTSSGASSAAGLTVAFSTEPVKATATINWTPIAAATINLVLNASDGTDTTTVNLTLTSPGPCSQNIPPVAVNVPENNRVDLACGQSITNQEISFLAPELGQVVTLIALGASAGLTVATSEQTNKTTASINWTPTAAATVNLVLKASDGINTTTVSLTFTSPGPCPQNIPPVAVNVPANNRVDLACGQSITSLEIDFLAPELDQAVTLTPSGASAGLTVATLQQTNTTTASINWTPTAAATVNLVLTAFDGFNTTTVTLTFTSPGPCPCQGTTAEIWNPTTNSFVQALVHGNTYCLKKYNLRAVPCQDVVESVLLKIWNRDTGITLKRQTERFPPYFLWGNTVNATGYVDVNSSPNKQLPNGNYALRINATNPNSYAEIRFKQSCPP